jgi:hypothetical protein
MPTPIHELPPDYVLSDRFTLEDRKLILRLNIAALIPLGIALVWMAVWQVIADRLRGGPPLIQTDINIQWWVGVILLLIIVLPLHELLHGLAMALVGHRAKFGFKPELGVLYALAKDKYFRRDEYLFVLLTPLVVITLLGMAINLIGVSGLTLYVAIGVILNAGGAVGDLWMTALVLRFPRRAIIQDEDTGFSVFVQK